MITCDSIYFQYEHEKQKSGLEDIGFNVQEGEVVLLCGPSGSGKTTITRMINGLIPYYYKGKIQGSIQMNGKNILKMSIYEISSMVGSVFQNPRSQFFNVDTTSELVFVCENLGLCEDEIHSRFEKVVDEMDLHKLIDRNIFQLSGGEKQRIACGSISMGNPKILVLDEPSSNLDSVTIELLKKSIQKWKEKGITIIIAEHRFYFLKDVIDRVFYIEEGQIKKEYDKDEFIHMSIKERREKGLRSIDVKEFELIPSKEEEYRNSMITFHNFIHFYKKGVKALNINDLKVPKGKIIAILGRNGAGKSTFARCLCGLEKKCRGVVEIDGSTYSRKERVKYCYMVMQDVNHQLFTETVIDEVMLTMEDIDEDKARNILESLGLKEFENVHPMSLSGGQKQRVAIASAIAAKREIFLLDEPTSGLDLKHMEEVARLLRTLSNQKKTIFVITHDMELVSRYCDYVIVLEQGEVIQQYSLERRSDE